jgi:hypothetical protein
VDELTARRERNRAMRVAYGHARRGDAILVDAWIAAAERFLNVPDRQRQHAEALLRARNNVIPGQLSIDEAAA